MTDQEFRLQIDRMRNTWGEKPFPDERVKLLWQSVNQFSQGWFAGVVDLAIRSLSQPPMPIWFSDHVAEERERLWKIEKEKNRSQAEKFMCDFEGEDFKMMCQSVRDVLS